MSRDHAAIGERIEALEAVDTATLEELLYGLHALITVHFAKEEDVCLPILESQANDRIRELLDRMAAEGPDHEHAE